jgi:hypothetical protein
MIIGKHVWIPSGITFGLLMIFLVFQNCGKDSAARKKVMEQSETLTQTNLRVDDLNNILLGMIENERKERIAADDEIMNKMNSLKTDLVNQILGVKSSIQQIDVKLLDINKKDELLSSQVSSLEQSTKNLEQNLNMKILETNSSLMDAIKNNKSELIAKLNLVDEQIAKLQNDTVGSGQELLKQKDQILAVIQSQKIFEDYVSQTYATKEEIAIQQQMYSSLEAVVKSLDLRLTRTSQEIADALGQRIFEVTSRITSLEEKVSSQGKNLSTLRSDLASAIQEYQRQHQELSDDLREEIDKTETYLGSMMIRQNQATRDELLTELNKLGLELTLYTNKAVTLLSSSLTELSKKVDTNNADQVALAAEIRQQMVDAITKEQMQRMQLGSELEQLIARVIRIELEVKDLQRISELNSKMLNRITVDFENEKVNVATRFAQQAQVVETKFNLIKNDFDQRLKDLASHAENLVKNLGAEVQNNFKNVNLEIATLTARQANAEKRLETFLEEYQQDRSRTASFASKISVPFRQAQGHIASSIDALSLVQHRFVQILAPDEDNPDFYDGDLKKKLASLNKKCNVAENTGFTNVYGLDSFQLISIEYARMLLTGLNSGDPKRDRIFFKFGPAAGNDRFAQTVIMSLLQTPADDVDKECKYEVQQWARAILLSDPRFDALADALAQDDEFERRVSVLYETLQNASVPLKQIQVQIEESVAGVKDREAIYNSMVTQTAIDLVNASWDSRQLSDRLALIDGLESVQTSQSELQEEMRAGFKDLRSKLKQFEEQTNTRLARIEDQQGKMSLSLRRALDVLISLADRGGYEDLKAYARWAGEPISYQPVVYPNWQPKISMVQHFFSGVLSLKNKTDACTGAKILPKAGIQGAYQFGTWGPCWVNFRSLPLPTWGNEFKTLWLRIFGAGHVISLKVDPAAQKEAPALFRNYNYNRVFDFRNTNDPLIRLTGTFDNGVFDIRVPDLLDFYLKNIRTWGGVTVSIQSQRHAVVGQETIVTSSNIFNYTIQVFSPLIIDLHGSSLPRTISSQDSKVKMNFTDESKFERSGWVSGYEAGFLLKKSVPAGTVVRKKHLFVEGEYCNNKAAADGFDALACLDLNQDGAVDNKDPGFKSLQVFFDFNSNGIVDAGEIKSLKDLGIIRLSTMHTTIPVEQAVRQGNDLRYQSSIYGERNQQIGRVFDIYSGVEK